MELKPTEIKQALHTVYEAVHCFVTSRSSRSRQMLTSLHAETNRDYNIDEVKDSHGDISPRELARKLWELLECDEESKHKMGLLELRSLSNRFCQQLEKWANDAENVALGLKLSNLETKDAEDRFTVLERAHQVFPNDDISQETLSLLIFAPFRKYAQRGDDKVMAHVEHVIATQGLRRTGLSVELMKKLDILVGRIHDLKPSYPVRYLAEACNYGRAIDEDAMDENAMDEDAMDEDATDEDATDEDMTPDTSPLTYHKLIATSTASA